jgi:hypothetical protein
MESAVENPFEQFEDGVRADVDSLIHQGVCKEPGGVGKSAVRDI